MSNTSKYCGNCWNVGLHKNVITSEKYWYCGKRLEKCSRDVKVEYFNEPCDLWEAQRFGEIRNGVCRK